MAATTTRPTGPPPRAATFRAQNRGGGLYSELVSQRVGSWIALAGYRLGLSPTALTMIGLAVGVGSSIALILLAGGSANVGWPIALAVGLGWQLAYAFDCADGQLARVTGRSSSAGARLDILCDVATQISVVTAIAAFAATQDPTPPAWLAALFAGTWFVNIVTSVLATGPTAASLIRSGSPIVRTLKLVRDYGAVILVAAVVLTAAPAYTLWFIVGLTTVNGLFAVISIAQATLASLVTPAE